uniref:Secreted protein n=1 Tax=Anguilla anguilla TaxID=7936 RepID=A0A0E9WRH4_ANGAN
MFPVLLFFWMHGRFCLPSITETVKPKRSGKNHRILSGCRAINLDSGRTGPPFKVFTLYHGVCRRDPDLD